jgi:hypothetical protein
MAAWVGEESDRWCIVLIVVETDGNLVLVVEPTRVGVRVHTAVSSVGGSIVATSGTRWTSPGAARSCACAYTVVGGSAIPRAARGRSSPNASTVR